MRVTVCSLGKVTQVDEARAQIGVHRCVPDATGLRITWRLGFMDEEGRLTSGEGARSCVESVTVKVIISKVDINKDGVLAAASARKLDKGGYVLQERARVERDSAVGVLDVESSCKALLILENGPQDSVLASARGTQKGTRILEWLASHPVDDYGDFIEVSWGPAAVHGAARDSDIAAAPAVVHLDVSYGVLWDLSVPEDIGAVEQLLQHLGSSCECFHLAGKTFPAELARLAVTRGHLAEKQGRAFAVALSGECFSKAWEDHAWKEEFGTLLEPHLPWAVVRVIPASMMKAPAPSLTRDPITG